MRTFINRVTKITGFGCNQVRIVVKVRDDRSVSAAQHHASWHASRLALYAALEALAQAVTTLPTPALCPAVGSSRSGEPMRLSMPFSVNG